MCIFRPLPEGGLFSFHRFVFLFSFSFLFFLLRFDKVIFLHKLYVHGYHRRGRQLLLAKVKYADRQDWYIQQVFYIQIYYKSRGSLSYLNIRRGGKNQHNQASLRGPCPTYSQIDSKAFAKRLADALAMTALKSSVHTPVNYCLQLCCCLHYIRCTFRENNTTAL